MAKQPENLPHFNYLVLVQSMEQNNGFKAWNSYVNKYFGSGKLSDRPHIALRHLNFENFDLRGARLSGTDFTGSRMVSCNMSGTATSLNPLRDVIFDYCDLRDTDLTYALLTNSSFVGATLINEDLTGAAQLKNANLKGSSWDQAYVASLQLSQAHIRGVKNIDPEVAREIADDIYNSLTKKPQNEEFSEKGNPDRTTSGMIDDSKTPIPEPSPLVGSQTEPEPA